MAFTYRDRPRLSDRLRGKSGEEILNEMKCDLDKERRMFFDSPWRSRQNNSGFPRGFPFDESPSRASNIRSYLDELASRHPEFADQLTEPPWSEDFASPSFGAGRRPGRRGGDVGEADVGDERPRLNQFGLRNTVPLGQSASSPEEQRRQRSMSAPPDSRAPEKPKRFISKCEIPIMQDPEQDAGKPPKVPKAVPEAAHKAANNSPSVRLIPIQVEGRDEPVINADIDTGGNFVGEAFREPPAFEARLPRDFGSYQRHSPRFAHKERPPTPQSQAPSQTPEPMPAPIPMPMPPPEEPSAAEKQPDAGAREATPKTTEAAKDPLAKVENIQKEVDDLRHQVESFGGKSRSDKEFIMLDELLTRKLISLDDIDAEGKENVRQARKDTIRNIQRCISLLESRVPQADSATDGDDAKGEDSTAAEIEADAGGKGVAVVVATAAAAAAMEPSTTQQTKSEAAAHNV